MTRSLSLCNTCVLSRLFHLSTFRQLDMFVPASWKGDTNLEISPSYLVTACNFLQSHPFTLTTLVSLFLKGFFSPSFLSKCSFILPWDDELPYSESTLCVCLTISQLSYSLNVLHMHKVYWSACLLLQHRCWWGACYEIDLIQENILNHNIYILYVWYILWDHPKAGFASAWWKSKDHREAEHEENSLGFIWAAGDPSKLECDGEMKQLITGVRINSYQPQYIFEVEQTPGEISKRRVCFIPVCTYSSLPI